MVRLLQFIVLHLLLVDLALGRNIERRAQRPARDFKDLVDVPPLLSSPGDVDNINTPFRNITGVAGVSRAKCDVSICDLSFHSDKGSGST